MNIIIIFATEVKELSHFGIAAFALRIMILRESTLLGWAVMRMASMIY